MKEKLCTVQLCDDQQWKCSQWRMITVIVLHGGQITWWGGWSHSWTKRVKWVLFLTYTVQDAPKTVAPCDLLLIIAPVIFIYHHCWLAALDCLAPNDAIGRHSEQFWASVRLTDFRSFCTVLSHMIRELPDCSVFPTLYKYNLLGIYTVVHSCYMHEEAEMPRVGGWGESDWLVLHWTSALETNWYQLIPCSLRIRHW